MTAGERRKRWLSAWWPVITMVIGGYVATIFGFVLEDWKQEFHPPAILAAFTALMLMVEARRVHRLQTENLTLEERQQALERERTDLERQRQEHERLVSSLSRFGITQIWKRGERPPEWKTWLEGATTLIFFGKDSSRLLDHHFDTMRDLLAGSREVTVTMYLLDEADPYYTTPRGAGDKDQRTAAIERIVRLRRAVEEQNPACVHRLSVWKYTPEPAISYAKLDDRIVFGYYLVNTANPDTPEFVIENPTDSWLSRHCTQLFTEAAKNRSELRLDIEPTPQPGKAAAGGQPNP
jgi:hypothetical protein